MQGDLPMDGYDVADAGSVDAESISVHLPDESVASSICMIYVNTASIQLGITDMTNDVIGCDGEYGYYAVPGASGTFVVSDVTTNNYLLIRDPLGLLGDTKVIMKVIGAGVSVSDNLPVNGMIAGDQYVMFDCDTVVTRTNSVTSATFGVEVAKITPSSPYLSSISVRAETVFQTSAAYGLFGAFASARWSDLSSARDVYQGVIWGQIYKEGVSPELIIDGTSLYFFYSAASGGSTTTSDVVPGKLHINLSVFQRYCEFNLN
jgi:hypothetical protein